ncbi:MAG: hypothetical protein PHU61_01130 [Candidatus Absconditabacteria bacterium]|nr:hypothetical protein [Candidatus Absconditabacteria bacterium]MDD3868098.1 hypothetical protein [Candidatus Absconditabacteria bacterium]MDD4714346.1 hypothetical protein [Candidatus Absconditabacteria bacterium]
MALDNIQRINEVPEATPLVENLDTQDTDMKYLVEESKQDPESTKQKADKTMEEINEEKELAEKEGRKPVWETLQTALSKLKFKKEQNQFQNEGDIALDDEYKSTKEDMNSNIAQVIKIEQNGDDEGFEKRHESMAA